MIGRIIKDFLHPLWIPVTSWDNSVLMRAEHRARELDNKSIKTEKEETEQEKLSDKIEQYRDVADV